ncbi:hypothetical protein JD844_003101 [Phrynosoma platyrhinos]|uniref:EGF-like domain-containing protein n=1 Tax=Phrynosoma platyrhinos TaxID=52577 RepID=A0ABQ7TE50_PHRPL|nr:hypothetical protein JD844_003101 [Phrynosoma platyrhinos]
MRAAAAGPLLLLLLVPAMAAMAAGGLPSKASRGLAVPFVFDPGALCSPPCHHGGLCIRNGTCFCAKGYEGERCQYVIPNFFRLLNPKLFEQLVIQNVKMVGSVSDLENVDVSLAMEEDIVIKPIFCLVRIANKNKPKISVDRMAQSSGTGRKQHPLSCEGGCQNGGECISVNGMVKCLCASGWTGSRCQEALCRLSCHHGGKCIAPDVCRCRPPYSGIQCTKKIKQ